MPGQPVLSAPIEPMSRESLVIWTSVGLNEQSTRAGKESFRQSEYPIAWYIGLEYGEAENIFARSFLRTIKSIDSKQATFYESKNSEGRDIYGYFNDFDTFKRVVEKVVGDKVLNVARFSGRVERLDAGDLLKMGEKALEKFEEEIRRTDHRSR